MSKGLKILYSLLGLILLTVLGNTIFFNQRMLRFQELAWLPVDFRADMAFREMLAHYFLWAATALFVLVLIAIIVVIFYPRRYSEIELANNKGKLKLKKSAVEGYVKTLVEAEGLMRNVNVVAELYKNSFKVNVRGKLLSQSEVLTTIERVKTDIETGLKAFFGIEQSVDFSVEVQEILEEGTQKNKLSRVE